MMHKVTGVKRLKCTKQQAKLLMKVEKELEAETDRQLDIIYHAAALALYRYHSWSTEQIADLVSRVSQEVWSECAESTELSMVQMLYDETGIELMSEDKSQRWTEYSFLNSELDDGRDLNVFQWIAMRQNQKKWVPAQIVACVLMALYRKEGWKVDGLGRLFGEMETIKHDYRLDPNKLREQSYEETGFQIADEHFLVPSKEA